MSTTLSTQVMVAQLQRKFPYGISSADAINFLNEAFRKVNQMSKDGFIWQLKTTTLNLLVGQTSVALPADFDPGKTALLTASTAAPTKTEIPYKPWQEFLNYQHFQTSGPGQFAAWSFIPNFSAGPPTSYLWTLRVAPDESAPAAGGATLNLVYHAIGFAALPVAANVYFPTPDAFDSLICDLAEAELSRVYKVATWDKIAAQATAGVQELMGTYRTDRYDLAGLTGLQIQGAEKQALQQR